MAEAERPRKIQKRVCEDRISSLPEDLLIHILLRVPTKDAVATTFLSKRWRFVWTMLPKLDYKETNNKTSKKNKETKNKSVWWFLDESMRFHKAPLSQRLRIKLGPQCPVDVDVVKWVAKAVDRRLRWLFFSLLWNGEPTRMPKSLYTCKTLAILTLSRKILVDVPCPVSLPSLLQLNLLSVVYKDEDSHVRLLSGCPVLKRLKVVRLDDDSVRKFSVKVPSLLRLTYENTIFQEAEDEEDTEGSLVIDTPTLMYLDIFDGLGHSCSTEYMPHLKTAFICVDFYPDGNLLRSLSSIKYLMLAADNTMDPWCNAVNYSRLIDCRIDLNDTNFCESLVVLLSNCPKLKVFTVDNNYEIDGDENHVPVLWNQPSSVPKCLSSHLEIFEWKGYEGRDDEKELIRYILEKSKCLKTVRISLKSTLSAEEKQKMIEELESMRRVSIFSARMLFKTLI